MVKKPDRIIIDTNLLISFLINKDFSKLDNIVLNNQAVIIISTELIEELLQVISRTKFEKRISSGDKVTLLEFFNEHAELVLVKSKLKICRDNDDDFLLNLAIDGKATHLITGDKDLLVLKKVRKTKIIKMESYLSSK